MPPKRKATGRDSPPSRRSTRSNMIVEVVIPVYSSPSKRTTAAPKSKQQLTHVSPMRLSVSKRSALSASVEGEDGGEESGDALEFISPNRSRQALGHRPKLNQAGASTSRATQNELSKLSPYRSIGSTRTPRRTISNVLERNIPQTGSSVASSHYTESSLPDSSAVMGRRIRSDSGSSENSLSSSPNPFSLRMSNSEAEEDDVDALLDKEIQKNSPSNLKHRTKEDAKQMAQRPFDLVTEEQSLVLAQRRAILRSLLNPPILDHRDPPGSANQPTAIEALTTLIKGTIERGEGNSCLIVGPRGSGKSRIISQALQNFQSLNPVVIRLSGEAQYNDRLAMREIARQLVKETGTTYALPSELDDAEGGPNQGGLAADSIPTTHLPALIATFTTLSRSVVVILDGFDLFAEHARQALLYCLLDTSQACRGGLSDRSGKSGLAVVGVTSRIDALNTLEKRVKSRFSGRTIRVTCPQTFDAYIELSRRILRSPIEADDMLPERINENMTSSLDRWAGLWCTTVETFLANKETKRILNDVFHLTKDIRSLCRVLTLPVLVLSSHASQLHPQSLKDSVETQITPPAFGFLPDLSYPCLAILVAVHHVSNTGHDTFTFEMLWSNFTRQVERTASMPVTVDGASVGMIKIPKETLIGAFENLVTLKVIHIAGPVANVGKVFVRYRSAVSRSEISTAVEKSGNVKLKSWLKRAAE